MVDNPSRMITNKILLVLLFINFILAIQIFRNKGTFVMAALVSNFLAGIALTIIWWPGVLRVTGNLNTWPIMGNLGLFTLINIGLAWEQRQRSIRNVKMLDHEETISRLKYENKKLNVEIAHLKK